MKLNVFYSWQSDLPNGTNRSFIVDCLNEALKNIYRDNNVISEYLIESDSRDETGTPDLVSTIFSKIDSCDIFIADVSIINSQSEFRKAPNPNVMIELGYASNKIGWEKILCVFNGDFGIIEDLPFDIRFRKPIHYKTIENKPNSKKQLISAFEKNIQSIIDSRLTNKKFYKTIKREVDLGLQAILFDFLKLLYFTEGDHLKKLDYNRLLHLNKDELLIEIKNKEFIGFQLFKNQKLNITEFKEFFNDDSNMHFFNAKERNILAQIIMVLRNVKRLFSSSDIYNIVGKSDLYSIIFGQQLNPENPKDGLILLEKTKQGEGIVRDSGSFEITKPEKLLELHSIKPEYLNTVVDSILEVTTSINDWIRNTGGVFIVNERELNNAL